MRAAIVAGVAAGVVSTFGELLLWCARGDPLPQTLYRDARFAAAIVLGRSVLPPPATFDALVMTAATIVHFALSIAYAFALAAVVARGTIATALAAGALFGSVLYCINMYGFTTLFPWFEATRDATTFAAHVLFGLAAALAYRLALHGGRG